MWAFVYCISASGSLRFEAAVITICGFAGTMADSVLGSLIQAKFMCSVCGQITEKETHCGVKTECVSGSRHINNDMVNFLSNCFTALLAVILI